MRTTTPKDRQFFNEVSNLVEAGGGVVIGRDFTRWDKAMSNGSHLLGEVLLKVVRIGCARCERTGRYRLDRLIERFGADAALPDVLTALASCERRGDFAKPCGAKFTDMAGSAG